MKRVTRLRLARVDFSIDSTISPRWTGPPEFICMRLYYMVLTMRTGGWLQVLMGYRLLDSNIECVTTPRQPYLLFFFLSLFLFLLRRLDDYNNRRSSKTRNILGRTWFFKPHFYTSLCSPNTNLNFIWISMGSSGLKELLVLELSFLYASIYSVFWYKWD